MASMSTARDAFAAAAVNNKIYALGGADGSNGYLTTNEEYDPPSVYYIHEKD